MKEKVSRSCLYFRKGNQRVVIEGDRATGDIEFPEAQAGCYYDEYGYGRKDCQDFCPQFYTRNKNVIRLFKIKGNRKFATHWDAVQWQKAGRKQGRKKTEEKIELDEEVELDVEEIVETDIEMVGQTTF